MSFTTNEIVQSQKKNRLFLSNVFLTPTDNPCTCTHLHSQLAVPNLSLPLHLPDEELDVAVDVPVASHRVVEEDVSLPQEKVIGRGRLLNLADVISENSFFNSARSFFRIQRQIIDS